MTTDVLVLAGTSDGRYLLRSDGNRDAWQDVSGLNAPLSRPEWWPGGGGLCLHTIILPEGQPGRVYAGILVAGFPVAAARSSGPAGCSVWVIPENGETIRTGAAEGLRVWRTDDGGETWSPSVNGLPRGQHNVLREGRAADMLDPAGVYVGTTGGALYASTDAGAHWQPILEGLPRIQSIDVSTRVMGDR